LLERDESYLVYRVRLELDRAADRQDAFVRVREILSGFEDSPERQDAQRLAADRLDLPPELQAGLASRRGSSAAGVVSAKVLDAWERRERDALGGCIRNSSLVPFLAELSPDHFDSAEHRRVRAHLVDGEEPEPELVPLLAELDAVAAAEEIDEVTTKELLLRLRERYLRRELAEHPGRGDLIEALARVREAAGSLA
jgi:hypothetical protein